MRPVISWSSYTRGASIAASTGWSADYPAANVLDLQRPTKVARGGTSLTIDLGAAVPVSFVGVAQHTLENSATIRVQAGSFDSGAASLAHQVSGWRQTRPFVFEEVTTDSVTLTFSDGADIGAIDVARALELPWITEGAQVGMLDAGDDTVLLGGVSLGALDLRLRTYDGSVPYLETSVSETDAWGFQQEMGTARPFVFVEDYSDPDSWSRTCFLATNSAVPGIASQIYGRDNFPFRLVEHVR